MVHVASVSALADAARQAAEKPRHPVLVRVTHGITTLCFVALLVSGVEIVISHPRFYWGETGNVLTPSLFDLPIPASRRSVPTGYDFVLPDQNGWSRSLHFQSAWVAVATGLFYVVSGLVTRHFSMHLRPASTDLSWLALSRAVAGHVRRSRGVLDTSSYNVLQRLTYLLVVFGLFPAMIWTGLAMSPAITSVFPVLVTVVGGQQSARTLHFFVTLSLVGFVLVHILMVSVSGFGARMRAMTTGGVTPPRGREQP